MKNKVLTIIIPTWNNPNALIYNLNLLEKSILALKKQESVSVIIGDDGSELSNRRIIENALSDFKIDVQYFYHDNLGLEKNELYLIEKVNTKYIMLLGEDDYLPFRYIKKVFMYLNKYEVGAILSNFYVIDENRHKTNRACRNRLKKDKIIRRCKYNSIFLAHQMSGLVFQSAGLLRYYRSVPSNVYPQLSFVANSISRGVVIHITDAPFACTVLKKRRFNYSIDGLAYELLKNVDALPVSNKERSKIIDHYLLNWSNQFCNLESWKQPRAFFNKTRDYKLLKQSEINKIKFTFLLSYVFIPFRVFYRLVILPSIGKMELKRLSHIKGVYY